MAFSRHAWLVISARGIERQYGPCVMAREQLPKSGYGTSMFGKSRSMPRSRPSLSSLITVMPGKASALRGACPASLFM